MAIAKSPAQLRAAFNEQLDLLRVSCRAYDTGTHAAAKQLATTLRVLLHDTKMSHSLLAQLGIKESVTYFSTPNPAPKADLQFSLVTPLGFGFVALAATAPASSMSMEYKPVFDYFPGTPIPEFEQDDNLFAEVKWPRKPFADWWDESVIKLGDKGTFTRRGVVLLAANKEGGAHLDSELTAEEDALVNQAVKFKMEGGGLAAETNRGMHYSTVRQIAYELQRTVDVELTNLCDQQAEVPPPSGLAYMQAQVGSVKVTYEKSYLESVLADAVKNGEGRTRFADQLRRQIYWETN